MDIQTHYNALNRYKDPLNSLNFKETSITFRVQKQPLEFNQNETKLTLFHINDTHRKLWPFPKLKTAFDSIGNNLGGDILKVHSGDYNIGSNPQLLTGEIKLMDAVGIDIATIGNHEFDMGIEPFLNNLLQAHFKTVSTNLESKGNSALTKSFNNKTIAKARILEINGHRYGFIGIAPIDLKDRMNPHLDLSGVEVSTLEKTVQDLRQQVNILQFNNINKIIAVSHAGYSVDKVIAQSVNGIDVIVGGHSHNKISGIKEKETLFRNPNGDPVLVLQAGKDGKYFGITEAIFNPSGVMTQASSKLELTKKYADHPGIAGIKQKIIGKGTPLAYMTHNLDTDLVREQENPLGNFLADALRSVTGAQIGIAGSSDIRENMIQGPITDLFVNQLLPFPNKILKVETSGEDIIHGLSKSAKSMHDQTFRPGIIYISGLKYTIDNHGQAKNFLVQESNGQYVPLNPQQKYTVGYSEYFFSGGEKIFNNNKKTKILTTFDFDTAGAFKLYLAHQPNKNLNLLNVSPRIHLEL